MKYQSFVVQDNVAFFSYPFSFESFFRKEDESEGEYGWSHSMDLFN